MFSWKLLIPLTLLSKCFLGTIFYKYFLQDCILQVLFIRLFYNNFKLKSLFGIYSALLHYMFDHYLFRSAYSASKNTIGSWLKLFWGQNYTWPPSLHLIPPRPCPDKCSNSRFFSLLLFLSLSSFPFFLSYWLVSFFITLFIQYVSLLFIVNCLVLSLLFILICLRLTLFPFLSLSLLLSTSFITLSLSFCFSLFVFVFLFLLSSCLSSRPIRLNDVDHSFVLQSK